MKTPERSAVDLKYHDGLIEIAALLSYAQKRAAQLVEDLPLEEGFMQHAQDVRKCVEEARRCVETFLDEHYR